MTAVVIDSDGQFGRYAKFWYLGSPYTAHPNGIYIAHAHTCREAARLVMAGVMIYAPIPHFHMIAQVGQIDPRDYMIWVPANEPFMELAHGIIVLCLPGWGTSYGLSAEIDVFEQSGKPVVYMEPGAAIPEELLA